MSPYDIPVALAMIFSAALVLGAGIGVAVAADWVERYRRDEGERG